MIRRILWSTAITLTSVSYYIYTHPNQQHNIPFITMKQEKYIHIAFDTLHDTFNQFKIQFYNIFDNDNNHNHNHTNYIYDKKNSKHNKIPPNTLTPSSSSSPTSNHKEKDNK